MKKKTDEELGILLTREMKTMMFNEKLSDSQKVQIFCAVVGDNTLDDPILDAFAKTLKVGYVHANNARISSIYKRRDRQRKTYEDERTSTEIGVDSHSSPIKGKGKGKGICIPLPPKGGKGENIPSAVSPDDLLKEARPVDGKKWADEIASEIVRWYPYEVNHDGLKKILMSKFKKNLARALDDGIAAWRKSGAWDEKRFVPPDIVKWIKLERFLDEPPQKKSPAARADGGRALAAPSADETMRMIESDGIDDGM